MNERPLDPERVAALLDGRLDEPDRARLLAELVESEDDLESLSDVAAVLRDLDAGDQAAGGGQVGDVPRVPPVSEAPTRTADVRAEAPDAPTVDLLGDALPKLMLSSGQGRDREPARSRPRRWVPLAAAAVLVIATGMWYAPQMGGRTVDDPTAMIALLETVPQGGDALGDVPWPVTRGADDPSVARTRAVRYGVRATELALAARRGDQGMVTRRARQIAALLGDVPGGGPAVMLYGRIAEDPATGASDEALRGAWEAGEAIVGEDEAWLGAWLGAAREAAARRDAAFFQGTGRRAADRAADALDALPTLSEPARAAVARLRRAADDDTPEWASLAGDVESLLVALGS